MHMQPWHGLGRARARAWESRASFHTSGFCSLGAPPRDKVLCGKPLIPLQSSFLGTDTSCLFACLGLADTQPDHLFPADVPIESLRLRFALLQSLNTTLETFFLPLVELRQTPMYAHSIAALLKEAKGEC